MKTTRRLLEFSLPKFETNLLEFLQPCPESGPNAPETLCFFAIDSCAEPLLGFCLGLILCTWALYVHDFSYDKLAEWTDPKCASQTEPNQS